jgi:hypothetical protein
MALLSVTLTLAIFHTALQPPAAQATFEAQVKAAFLYNFTKFVDWPPAAMADQDPFRLCIAADDAFAGQLQRIIEDESVQGHAIRITRIAPSADVSHCQILYVSSAEQERAARLITAARQSPALIVTDTPALLDSGAGIAFVVDEGRVRFDINAAALDRAGLKASSKLLRVARNVQQGAAR